MGQPGVPLQPLRHQVQAHFFELLTCDFAVFAGVPGEFRVGRFGNCVAADAVRAEVPISLFGDGVADELLVLGLKPGFEARPQKQVKSFWGHSEDVDVQVPFHFLELGLALGETPLDDGTEALVEALGFGVLDGAGEDVFVHVGDDVDGVFAGVGPDELDFAGGPSA